MILIDNPNNPTGNLAALGDIIEIASTNLPVLVDEAYYEFGGETIVPMMKQYPNLMVLRTFSKWAGLAGLRIGYGLFPPVIADYLMRIKLPYNVNVAAIIAVRESLNDIDYLMGNVRAIIAERERLFQKLKSLRFLKPYPSRANFILCSVENGLAAEVCHRLEQKGIQIRYFGTPTLNNYVRISVGRPEHTDMLIEALCNVGEEING
jgi:histidinol-phosphate aminotransferase